MSVNIIYNIYLDRITQKGKTIIGRIIMKKPYEEPILEITLFSVTMAGSTDGVTDDGIVDVGGGGNSDWWD